MAITVLGWGSMWMSSAARADARGRVNGFGYGEARCRVTAAAPPNNSSGAGGVGFNFCCNIPDGTYANCDESADLPVGADNRTYVGGRNFTLWRNRWRGREAGGDSVGQIARQSRTTNERAIDLSGSTSDCDYNGSGDFQITVSGSQYFLSGTWDNSAPSGIATVTVICNEQPLYTVTRSGVWGSETVQHDGQLCEATPGNDQTIDDWYKENLFLETLYDVPLDPTCVVPVIDPIDLEITTGR